MKKLLFIAILFFVSNNLMNAQVQIGAGLTFQTKYDKAGFQLKGTYGINEMIEASAGLNFIFSEKVEGIKTSIWELNVDGHYLFSKESGLLFYPLAGINFTNSSVKINNSFLGDYKAKDSKIGLNIGGGVAYPVSESIRIIVEAKVILASSNATRIGLFAGANYSF